ncbi:MAG TPA: TetR family transcriptional regulator [Pseudonocardia sp.]|nr:TetR family transcriptional regulator [Pseudonocardia sp.]
MADRRTEILDGALRVLAAEGMRGLTHRAVDTEAGIPPGSTSYYFRTRSALVGGCVARLLERDLETELPAVQAAGTADAGSMLDVLTGIGVAMATTERHRTLARFELSLAAVRDEELREQMAGGGDVIRRLGGQVLAARGVADPERVAGEVAAVLDGLVLTALIRGPRDPAALAAWMRPVLARALAG